MLVTPESGSGPPSRTPSILDSPTLARVERARLRLEASTSVNGGRREDSLERSILDPKHSLLAGRIPISQMTGPIKRGLLWQQRDRLFSRWKERYFILTRDYLHCFKRASGSSSEKISDMGQFIFKVKLVDVEKVEWLNRRSYSVIGLLLGREGRVLLRCDSGLEDWFELLEECALVSKERRMALRLTQGPRSRASLAAPPTHASLQSGHHMGLGSTYSSALEDWLHAKNKNFLHADSVPDLSQLSENNGLLTNQSTPKKIPKTKNGFHIHTNGYASHNGSLGGNNSSYTPYSPLKKLLNNSLLNNSLVNNNNSSCLNGNSYIINDADEDEEVELRQHNLNGRNQQRNGHRYRSSEREEDMYRRPYAPSEQRHSLLTDIDISGCDSGLDTPPSTTHRPSSYRDVFFMSPSKRDSCDTAVSSSRGTLVHTRNSFRCNNNLGSIKTTTSSSNNNSQQNSMSRSSVITKISNISDARYSVQEKILRSRNDDDNRSIHSNSNNNIIMNEYYESNNHKYNGNSNGCINGVGGGSGGGGGGGNGIPPTNGNSNGSSIGSSFCGNAIGVRSNGIIMNGNGNHIKLNGLNGTGASRDRYQHPALKALINEAQSISCRDRSYSDCQQMPRRNSHQVHHQWNNSNNNNNNVSSPSSRRNYNYIGTPTRV